jgi:hypothetical protein
MKKNGANSANGRMARMKKWSVRSHQKIPAIRNPLHSRHSQIRDIRNPLHSRHSQIRDIRDPLHLRHS